MKVPFEHVSPQVCHSRDAILSIIKIIVVTKAIESEVRAQRV